MPPLAATVLQTTVWDANVAALAARQPALAGRLRAAAPPPTARIAAGRDGRPVVVLEETAEFITWLGGSSMPSVSAPAAIAEFQDRGGNVALASAGTGYEVQFLAARLSPHRAVFVCEPDTVHLALALAVVDLADLIRAGRVVLLDGDIEAALLDFLTAHPGYCCPAQVYVLPGMEPAAASARTTAVERAVPRAEAARRAQRRARPAHPARARRRAGPPSLLILSPDPLGGAVEQAARLASACAVLEWPVAACVPDLPERCSRYARSAALDASDADFVLFLNCTPGAHRSELPATCRWASWFLDGPALPAEAFEGLADCTHVFAASTAVGDRLRTRGARENALHILEVGIDETIFHPPAKRDFQGAAGSRIAVLCDVIDVSSTASSIGLESHQRIWAKAQELLAKAAQRGGPIDVDAILRTAERQAAAPLSDDDLRTRFAALIASRLVKSVVARTVVERLGGSGEIALWGAGWSAYPSVSAWRRGPLPTATERKKIYHDAQLVVLPYVDAAALHFAAEALASGCCPLLRQPDARLLSSYPQSGDILAKAPTFRAAAELPALARKWLQDVSGRGKLVAELGRRIRAEHTVAHRLRTIQEWLSAPPK